MLLDGSVVTRQIAFPRACSDQKFGVAEGLDRPISFITEKHDTERISTA